jgi:hypothetical protein
MPLPSSGTLSINQIRTELGTTNASLRQLSAIAGFSTSDSISEFYGYSNQGYVYPQVPLINRFDFSANNYYSNSGSTIDDLSSYGWDGTFVTGTGNGTTATIDQYTSTYPGYFTIPGDSPQKAIRLNDNMKFSGTTSHTIVTWVRVSSFSSNYPGIVAAEGRSGSTPIGWSLYMDNQSGFHINYTRWNGTSGTGQNVRINFADGVVPAFAYDTWYMVSIVFDGSTMAVYLHTNGYIYLDALPNSYSLATSTSWSAFIGLRYNNWFNGRIGYYCVYGSALTSPMLASIYTAMRGRYGV